MMERKIEIEPGMSLDYVISLLRAKDANGEQVYCIFNGHVLHSKGITVDSAYKEVTGLTKIQFELESINWIEEAQRRRDEEAAREKEYAKKVEEARTEDSRKITKEKIVAGIKFITENIDLSHMELVEGLLALGCGFSLADIKEQFPEPESLGEGILKGSLGAGASIIANVRDSEFGRRKARNWYIDYEDQYSIYKYIRLLTGDETYTKENVDAIRSEKKLVKSKKSE